MRTLQEYRDTVNQLAVEAIKEGGREHNVWDRVCEYVDQSDWIIYTSHNLAVMLHTDNDDAIFDALGNGALADCDSTAAAYQRIAYYAMGADIMDEIGRIESEA